MMSVLVQNVSMQQLKHEYEAFLKRFYRKLLILQPEVYIISNITKDAVHLQVTWKVYLGMNMLSTIVVLLINLTM